MNQTDNEIKKFFNIISLNDKNKWINDFIKNNKITILSENNIWNLLEILFQTFKHNFENSNYEEYEYAADVCEELLNRYLAIKPWEELIKNSDKIDFIIDIVSFIYEQTYKYTAEAKILEKIIETDNVKREIKIKALERILFLADEPETNSYISGKIGKYKFILEKL